MNLQEKTAWITHVARRVIDGDTLSFEEATALLQLPDAVTPFLLGWADVVRKCFHGNRVDLCAIVNARAGRCSEDCRFCTQAACYHTRAPVYPLLPAEGIIRRARAVRSQGIKRFSLVTSGRDPGGDFEKILGITRQLKREVPELKLCASLGIISPTEARALKEAGLDRYHHNLETAASFFPEVCTTHRYEDRVATIRAAQKVGLEVCAGGIIGLGEKPEQRVELALALRELGVTSVPVNILHPVPGTPLATQPPLPALEILRTLAVFRLLLPATTIRYAGGREHNLRDTQVLGLAGGVDALITGDYLTTAGQGTARDRQLIRDLGLEG
ncbi:biotin synthase BioB [Candidatus Desulforudis audaxviator]|uniref:Biotin synthase n=1 Tax=Desulforudis audaxviator (strain MP104C) TaxID=477974 RepID=BIOB_DESAP|nr:biotin synthase BioB [Candidatus Desulforudis audaxviator]B1I4G4.1 RecName: Full=Biotin synthase [Candidatus Desulforudis audaxviator MP104C]ACA59841.1 biotin synthase [Candidatus Desulforudis audaxviator MP104C]AZK59845.1 Biotin synthase BioB [Candidatus Desulforudis audaxviator]